jgi:Uma2 family endonuclease
MEVLKLRELVSVADYLAGEPVSEFRHEYIGGEIHAMAGASEEHNAISGNLFAALLSHLKGRRCRTFIHDMKVRLQIAGDDIFYYPDVMVACDPRDTDRYFKRFPTVIVEVLSPETERTDRREKFLSYQQIETLEEYVLVAQDKSEVTVFRRANQWRPEIVRQASDSLTLSSLGFALALVDLYDGVNLSAAAGAQ